MKKAVFLLWLVCVLTGCEVRVDTAGSYVVAGDTDNIIYTSDTSPEDCRLCGNTEDSMLLAYLGQKNLGIISLNTFEILALELNRYDENGKLIEENAGYMMMGGFESRENGFSAQFSQTPDRGYADITLTFNEDEVLDIDKVAGFLCADCLNEMMKYVFEDNDCYGVGVIDFSTKEIRLLEEQKIGFELGDWYIDCDLQEPIEKGNPLKMDFLIFYCPLRYPE